jgi:hypothetical protein
MSIKTSFVKIRQKLQTLCVATYVHCDHVCYCYQGQHCVLVGVTLVTAADVPKVTIATIVTKVTSVRWLLWLRERVRNV